MNQAAASHHESNRRFYDRISEAYDFLSDANEKEARQTGVKLLELKPGESVLELGFGTGNELIEIAGAVGPKGRISGIDISSGMLAVTQRKLAKIMPQAKVDLRVADARKLPFADKVFDAVYSSFTIELFQDSEMPLVLSEVRRTLKDQGRIGIVSMSKPGPAERVSFLEKTYVWMHRHFPHIVDCHPIDVVGLLTKNGFNVRKHVNLEIWTLPVAAVIATAA